MEEYYKGSLAKLPKYHNWLRWMMKKKKIKKAAAEVVSSLCLNSQLNDCDQHDKHKVTLADDGSVRVFVGTWNVAGRSPKESLVVDMDEWLNPKEAPDIYVIGFQETVPLKVRTVLGAEDESAATKWNCLIGRTLKREYKLMASKKMVGVFVSVWMKEVLRTKYRISKVEVCKVACGIMGWLGNKGSMAVSFSMEGTSFCFVAVHLASGEKRGDEMRRNQQVLEIFKRTSFPRASQDHIHDLCPLTILGHDRIFWFGDLNYRLNLEASLVRQLIKKKEWRALQEFDQLRIEQANGGVFQGWREAHIDFAPTYKLPTNYYSSSSSFNGLPSTQSTIISRRSSPPPPAPPPEKQRIPAWCDRILWYGKDVKQLSYLRTESKFSDHSPVSALFSTHIELLNPST